MFGQILEILGQCQTNTLNETAVEVSVYQQLVHDGTYIGNAGEFLYFNLTGLGIYTYLRQEQGVHINGERIALGGGLIYRMLCAIAGNPLALNLNGYAICTEIYVPDEGD